MAKYFFSILVIFCVIQPEVVNSFWGFGSDMGAVAAEKLMEGIQALASSIDNGAVFGEQAIRQLSYDLLTLLDNFTVRLDSGDLAHVGSDAARSLQLAMSDLSKNWKVSISSNDLKFIGADAFSHLGEALKNLSAKIVIILRAEADDNVRQMALYIAVGATVSLCVWCVGSVLCFYVCRKCGMAMLQSLEYVTCNFCIFGTVENQQPISEASAMKLETISEEPDVVEIQKCWEGNNDGANLTGSVVEYKDHGFACSAQHLSVFVENEHTSTCKTQTYF